jgi:hypothetical protein
LAGRRKVAGISLNPDWLAGFAAPRPRNMAKTEGRNARGRAGNPSGPQMEIGRSLILLKFPY